MTQRVVIAIGGNSLIKDERHQEVEDQLHAVQETAGYVADFIKLGHDVVLTHGNGPQVGFILRRSELAFEARELHFVPLKNCVADTQGAIGYQIQESLGNAFRARGMDRSAATVVTLVEVDPDDPSFAHPTKPIGVFYKKEKVDVLVKEHPDWHIVFQEGRGYRRVVPSPLPVKIIEMAAIRTLADAGICVIAAGGGGIPVVRMADGNLSGVNAVVDKDLTGSLLASEMGADMLVILTPVTTVFINFNKPDQRALERITAVQARQFMTQGQFAPGSMLPKIQAAVNFLDRGGRHAIITSPENLIRAVKDNTGTHIVPGA
ncbi:MAG: carbamate kinase [Pseudomonadota bacterium]